MTDCHELRPRIVVIGGSTGGASFAAQARRMSEEAEIILIEKTDFVSTAYCGLAYAMGGIVKTRDELIPLSPEALAKRFRVDVRLRQEAVQINRATKQIIIYDQSSDDHYALDYDKLMLTPGAASRWPDIEGIDTEGVFTLRNIPDLDQILHWIDDKKPQRAVVIGGGFIGLESVESLVHRNLAVTLIEAADQVMVKIDREMATKLHEEIRTHGVDLRLNTQIERISKEGDAIRIDLSDGKHIMTDMVLTVAGIAPQTQLAELAELEIGQTGGIVVDDVMRTEDPHVYALGDAVELMCLVTGEPTMVSLAAPLSQQVRVAASHMTGGDRVYKGVLGSFVCKVFNKTVASTGASERRLKAAGIPYEKILLPGDNHVYFFPGVASMIIKLLFCPKNGKVLGAQVVGGEGADKRLDVLATAITAGMTIYDLEYLELAYAPPYGAPRDPVNLAGSVAASLLRGQVRGVHPDQLEKHVADGAVLVDTRTEDEYELSHVPGAINIPAVYLRERAGELPKDKTIIVICNIGSKANSAQRMLSSFGFDCYNLLGGLQAWKLHFEEPDDVEVELKVAADVSMPKFDVNQIDSLHCVDATGLTCPGPIVELKRAMKKIKEGETLEILVTDAGFPRDVRSWAKNRGHEILEETTTPEGVFRVVLRK